MKLSFAFPWTSASFCVPLVVMLANEAVPSAFLATHPPLQSFGFSVLVPFLNSLEN